MGTKHTPEPWDIVIPLTGCDEVRAVESGYLICELPYGAIFGVDGANANLIAAAPELLAALIELNELAIGPADGVTVESKTAAIANAFAAIAKATA
jgi:hypothetical protein